MLPLSVLILSLTALEAYAQTSSPKRGLVYIPSTAHPDDDATFLSARSSLTWYYNYQSLPSSDVTGTAADLQFVPMLWGDRDNTFVADVQAQLPAVKYVLGFNEPNMELSAGGSSITPQRAADLWRTNIQPLAADGVKLGAPAVSSASSGIQWLQSFMTACSGCTIDFIPIHWYGDFGGLASYLGYINSVFPNHSLWVTELGYANVDIQTTEAFFNTTIEYLDRLGYVTRYSWFGAFRSDVSNVGPNGAMLNDAGELTDLGAWYLGEAGTGVNGAAAGRRSVSVLAAFVAVVVMAILGAGFW